jgi:hypothetical protein
LVFPCGGSTTLEVCFIISITISLSLYLFIFLLWLFGWHVSICFLYFLFLSKCHLVYNKLLGDVFWSTKHVLDLHFTLKPNIWNITVCVCVCIYIYTNMYHMNIYSQSTCNICRYIFKRKEFEAKVNILLKSSIWQTHSSHSI